MPIPKRKSPYIAQLTLIVFVVMIGAIVYLRLTKGPVEDTPVLTQESFDELVNQLLPKTTDLEDAFGPRLDTEALQSFEAGLITEDHGPLRSRLSKPAGDGPFPTVIIVHDAPSSSHDTDSLGAAIGERLTSELGVVTLTIDWTDMDFGAAETDMVRSAIQWVGTVAQMKDQPILVLGYGHGAYMLLSALAHQEEGVVDGIVTVNGYVDLVEQYHSLASQQETFATAFLEPTGCATVVDTDRCLNQLTPPVDSLGDIPLLSLHAQSDTEVLVQQVDFITQRTTNESPTIHIVEDAAAGHPLLTSPLQPGFDEAWLVMTQWMQERIIQLKAVTP